MKKKYKLLIYCLLGFIWTLPAQSSLDSLLIIVRQSNKTLIAAKELNKLKVESSKVGINPQNPEVEIGYLFGSPENVGNRTDFSISQSFDFPTTYIHKNKAAKILRSQATTQMQIKEQEIFVEAKRIWIEQVFLNQKQLILSKRLINAEKLQSQYQRKLATGELNKLQTNKVALHTSLLRNEYDKIEMELHKNKYAIMELNGGNLYEIHDTIFPNAVNVLADSILMAYENSPEKKLLLHQLDLKKHEKSLVSSKKFPKFNIGYYSENIVNENFNGIKLGLSIPLWENKNTLKKAKSAILFAEAELNRFENYQSSKIQQMLDRREHLQKQITELSNSLININDLELLTKALDAGEISLTEYYYDSDFYFRSQIRLLEMQKEQLLLEVDLLKIFQY